MLHFNQNVPLEMKITCLFYIYSSFCIICNIPEPEEQTSLGQGLYLQENDLLQSPH